MKKYSDMVLSRLVRYRKRIKLQYLLVIILILFVFDNGILIYDNFQNKTPILGLQFEHKSLTGLTGQQIEALIKKEVDKRNRPLLFVSAAKAYQLIPSEIGYTVNAAYLANNLLGVGRTGNFFHKFMVQQRAFFGMENTMITGTFSQSLLLIQINQMQDLFNQNPQVETLDFTHDMQAVIPAKDGVKIQTDKLNNEIISNIANPSATPLPVPTYIAFASIHTPQELDPIRQQAQNLLTLPISITSNNKTLTFTVSDLRDMLTVVERPDPDSPDKTKLVLRIDNKKLSQRIGLFAAPIEMQTHTEFNEEDAKVAILSQFFSGKRELLDIPTGNNFTQTDVLGASTQKTLTSKPQGLSQQKTDSQIAQKVAYLTFDDGPNTIYHPMILDILKTYNVKATFFLIGQNAQRDANMLRRTVVEGHLIGNHSLTHSFMPNLSSTAITGELQATNSILNPVQSITLFRPPFGGINYYVRADAHNVGLKIFLWDVDPQDWAEPPTDELVRRVVSATHDGSNILLHSNHIATVRALPRIIESLQAEGFTFKRLDQYPRTEED